jgi:hypothetical protein
LQRARVLFGILELVAEAAFLTAAPSAPTSSRSISGSWATLAPGHAVESVYRTLPEVR